MAVTGGVFDEVPVDEVAAVSRRTAERTVERLPGVFAAVRDGETLDDDALDDVRETARRTLGE